MADRDTTAGYELVFATHSLPVHLDPLRWQPVAGSVPGSLRQPVAARGAAWTGFSAGSAAEPQLLEGLWLHPVPLSGAEITDYYHGHCLSTLTPLYFDCGQPAQFSAPWREAYRRVNYRLAHAVANIAAPAGTVWIHDHHLQMVPGYLRQIRPDLHIGFFLHSPFPPVDRFAQQPMREQILAGLLGADLIGFQQVRSAVNFLGTALELGRLPHRGTTLEFGERRVATGVFPASVDAPRLAGLAEMPHVRARASKIRSIVGDPRLVLLSVGGPEYADGVRRRLNAYADLLAEGRLDATDTVLIHVGTYPDGGLATRSPERENIERQIAQINGTHARIGHPVIHYERGEVDLPELAALYLAADVMLATALRQGMSLAAKEFVATRTDDTGRLVLSEFSGAAAELPEADIVNPYDIDAVKASILRASATCHTPSEAMGRMRQRVRTQDVEAWCDMFLAALAASSGRGGHPDLAEEACP